MWGYPTSLIFWFININRLHDISVHSHSYMVLPQSMWKSLPPKYLPVLWSQCVLCINLLGTFLSLGSFWLAFLYAFHLCLLLVLLFLVPCVVVQLCLGENSSENKKRKTFFVGESTWTPFNLHICLWQGRVAAVNITFNLWLINDNCS